MKVPAPSLIPVLRSDVQGRLLARLFADPSTPHSLSDLVAWTASSLPTVHREVGRAEAAGIVTTEKVGPTRLVRANPDHPLHAPLAQVIIATYGPPAIIAREFADVRGADAVVLFGSWAARYLGRPGRAPNDIDVLVIGSPERDIVDDAAERAERILRLPVQAAVRSRAEWASGRDSFVREVKNRPLVVVAAADDVPDLPSTPAHATKTLTETGRLDEFG